MGKTPLLAPGFRFHPTDVELVMYYLKRKVMGKRLCFEAIAEVDIYKFAPWELPDKSLLKGGDLKWYFFCPVEKKYSCGARMNRATEFGHWKVTGKDKHVHYNKELVGSIKALIFHRGRGPRGERTDWVMHEYRLEDKNLEENGVVQNTYVLCMIFQKEGVGPRNGAQYGAPFKEEDWDDDKEVDCVESGPSAGLSTPTYVLPNNNSSSVAIDTPSLGCLVSVSCLSQTMPTHCEGLTTVCSNDVVYQALGDNDILPDVLPNNDDDILALLASFTEDSTLISIEDDKNKDPSHGGNPKATLDFNASDIHRDAYPGHTTGLSADDYNLDNVQEPIFSPDQYFNVTDLD